MYSVVLDLTRSQACSGSMDGTVRVWNLRTGECAHTLTGHSSLVGLLGLSPSYLVSAAADSTLRIWDPDTGELRHTLAAHTGAITCFQHDEFKVLSGSDGTLKMWNVRDGTVVRDLLTGITGVWQVVFEGRWCVAASNRNDMTVLDVWDFGKEGDDEWIGEMQGGMYDEESAVEDDEDEEPQGDAMDQDRSSIARSDIEFVRTEEDEELDSDEDAEEIEMSWFHESGVRPLKWSNGNELASGGRVITARHQRRGPVLGGRRENNAGPSNLRILPTTNLETPSRKARPPRRR